MVVVVTPVTTGITGATVHITDGDADDGHGWGSWTRKLDDGDG
ncbi:MAG TPA: hypothetical protein VFO77_01390 [Actinoplanes sp.]|nr:hypothetical protein [Actinoplanes sp.]